MKNITLSILTIGLILAVSGCDRLKGDKGDEGPSGMIGTKTYTGTPTSNPFTISCPEISDTSKQVINVYLIKPDAKMYLMPITYNVNIPNTLYYTSVNHVYYIDGKTIVLETLYTNTSTALLDPDGNQSSYKIEIKTFSSSAAAISYKRANRLDKTISNQLVFGKEVDINHD